MAEAVTLANFRADVDSVYDVGATEDRPGVIEEISTAFEYTSDDLGGLVDHIAPRETLQDNIAYAAERLSDPSVKAALGYEDKTAPEIAREWGVRSELQARVFRPLMEPAAPAGQPAKFDVAIETDGVVRWMQRMAAVATEVAGNAEVERMLLVSGGRLIGGAESPDVEAGTPVNRYMGEVLIPQLAETALFGTVELIGTDKKDGPSVTARAVAHLAITEEVDLASARVLIPAVAGNWPQKGVQVRQALQKAQPGFDTNPDERQLWVASDEFPLGVTAEEPKATHQNPLSAIGNILRSIKLLDEVS